MTGYESKRAAAQDKLAQPAQEPVCPACKAGVLYECVACSSNNYPQPAQEPVAWMNKHGDCKSAVFREAEAGAKEEYNIPLYTNQTLEKNT